MSKIEEAIARHYSHGTLSATITDGLAKLRAGSDTGLVDLLASVDEFHIGGRLATKALAESLKLRADHKTLDIGCGLGGTARFLATAYGCKVEGIDLTPEYISVGNELNELADLSDQINLTVASATDLPMADAQFDRISMLHVGMNIADKKKLMQEAARVLSPGGLFGIYDVMLTGADPIAYPVPWASDASTSFIANAEDYKSALKAAGFEIVEVEDKRVVALEFVEKVMTRFAKNKPPPLERVHFNRFGIPPRRRSCSIPRECKEAADVSDRAPEVFICFWPRLFGLALSALRMPFRSLPVRVLRSNVPRGRVQIGTVLRQEQKPGTNLRGECRRTVELRCAGRLSRITTSPGRNVGARMPSTQRSNKSLSIAPLIIPVALQSCRGAIRQ